MAVNRGKQFESKCKEDFEKCFGKGSIDRIYDSVSGYASISNISDFIGYSYPNIFYIECKSHLGASFPIANLTQYEKLKAKVGIKGMRVGMILWLIEKDVVYYVPIATVTQLIKDGYKSINPAKLIPLGYRIIEVPSIKRRIFLDSDYSILANLKEGD